MEPWRHHTDTVIVGRDPEIAFILPPKLIEGVPHFVGILGRIVFNLIQIEDDPRQASRWLCCVSLKVLARNAAGIVTPEEKSYIPETEGPKAVFAARVHMAIYAITTLAALVMASILPLMLIGMPQLYGCWHMFMTGLLQHGGLAEEVIDHRLNSRSVNMNLVSRWIYRNMNDHVEHYMSR